MNPQIIFGSHKEIASLIWFRLLTNFSAQHFRHFHIFAILSIIMYSLQRDHYEPLYHFIKNFCKKFILLETFNTTSFALNQLQRKLLPS